MNREEYIEQAYLFRCLNERMAANMAIQDILVKIDQEILSTTQLPFAIQFLGTELKHSGLLSSGLQKLPHYFTQYQTYVIAQTEDEASRFSIQTGLLILEREAKYRAGDVSPAGLFIYQIESLSRNRLGYDQGLTCMATDPYYSADWQAYIAWVRKHLGSIDFGDLIYLRSDLYVVEQRRSDPDYEPPVPALFGEKEGKIAKANRGRDPLYLFAALQRQLGYPEVPRPVAPDDVANKILVLQTKLRDMELRLRLIEAEMRGQVDLSQFIGKPEDLLKDDG